MAERRYQSAAVQPRSKKAPKPRAFRHLESERVRRRLCRECRRMTLAGVDEGAPVAVDLHPIPQTEEVAALVAGRATYAMLWGDVLCLRDVDRIAGGLVGRGIYVEHHCGAGTGA